VKLREKLIIQQDAYNEKMNTYENEISDSRENLSTIQKDYLVEKKNNEDLTGKMDILNRVVSENVVIVDGLKEEVICVYIDTCICRCVYTYKFMYICVCVLIDKHSCLCVHSYTYLCMNIAVSLLMNM
jgi:hypothetical protein